MRIQHNIPAMSAYRNYTNNNSALAKNLEKLSSGYKINRAGDDAAGLAISEKMRAQITGLEVAQKNAKDGISLVQTAEGALTEVHDMLNRMYELAEQSANGTYDNDVDRVQLQKEIDSLSTEIDRIADSANFNGIKLLDGVSGSGRLSKVPVEYGTVSATKGVTIDSVKNGGGSKGVYTVSLDKMLTWGDTITVTGQSAAGAALSETYTMSTAGGATDVLTGNNLEEQAKNLADAMASKFGADFDISTDGGSIILTAKKEGTSEVGTITSATVGTDADVNATFTEHQAAAANGASTASKQTINLFGNGTTGNGVAANLEAGDTVTLAFKNGNGDLLTHSFTVTEAMADSDANKAMAAILEHLNSDEAVFDDNDAAQKGAITIGASKYDRVNTTGTDESKIKLKDLFTFATDTNNGQLKITGSTTTNVDTYGMVVNHKGSETSFAVQSGGTSAGANGSTKAQIVKLTSGANNFTTGDKVAFKGTLADGRTFEIELEAGKDFAVDLDDTNGKANTIDNLKAALMSDKTVIQLKDADGKAAGTLKGSDLFGDATTSADVRKEFTLDSTDTPGTLIITATSTGLSDDHAASSIDVTNSAVKPLADAKASLIKTTPDAKSAATSVFTLDDKLDYGTAIRVGDHTYEIVKDAAETSNRKNTAIVVQDPTDSASVAKAIAAAINGNESDYTAKAVDGKVTVSSNTIGSDQVALAVSTPYGDKVRTATFEFDPTVVKENSKLDFNGATYEFVAKGADAKTEGAIAIEIDDFSKATAKTLGDAFADVIRNGSASVDENGVITLRGTAAEDGTVSDVSVRFENNLVLQIGDTAEDFNQLTVSLENCHADAMGIGNIDITKQGNAKIAMSAIKDAINYISDVRGTFGATQNRLDHTINNLSVMQENIQDAESSIRDVDVAKEMMEYTKNNILVQSAQAMLAQANQLPQGVLQLLQ